MAQAKVDVGNKDEEVKESKEDIERKKAVEKSIEYFLNEGTLLIVDGKGWNIKYFSGYHVEKEHRDAFASKYQCKSCSNVCRDCVEIEQPEESDADPMVMCEVCAIAENKKYTPYKVIRKMILKEQICLPDPQKKDAVKWINENDITKKSDEADQTWKENLLCWGSLSKMINTKIPKMAQETYEQTVRSAEMAKLKLENGIKKDLDWKLHDGSKPRKNEAKEDALFFISEDGVKATSNKRSGTVLYGPFITALQYSDSEWVEDWRYAGNYYVFEFKLHDANGCSVGFCLKDFNQFVGKNEAASQCVMLNQSGWFYINRTFHHKWEHSRGTPMGKWFKSEDVIVVVVDCTDPRNVKGEIYNKANAENKFTIEKLPKHVCLGVNLIVGSNPQGTVKSEVSVVSATVERRM
eukprot:29336_1